MQKFTREEWETILSYDYSAKKWVAWTNIPAAISKFRKQGWTLVQERLYDDGTVECCRFEAPKGGITIARANRTKRQLSPEHIEKMQAARAAKGGENE